MTQRQVVWTDGWSQSSMLTSDKGTLYEFRQLISSPLQFIQVRNTQAHIRFYSKTTNKIKNIAADNFHGRTSIPHFVTDPNSYPKNNDPNENLLIWKINSALYDFRLPNFDDHKKHSIRDNMNIFYSYVNKSTAISLFSSAHVVEALIYACPSASSHSWTADNEALFRYVWDDKWIRGSGAAARAPEPREGLGRELHSLNETEAAAQLVAVGLLGARKGHHGWRRFNRVLIQGGWPWLNGYSKVFAKAVFVTLVCLFAAIDQGLVVPMPALGRVMIELVRPLLKRDGGGQTSLKIRMNDRLKDVKAIVYGIKLSDPTKSQRNGDSMPLEMQTKQASVSMVSLRLKSKNSATVVSVEDVDNGDESKPSETKPSETKPSGKKAQGWTLAEPGDIPKTNGELPIHIITTEAHANRCNHGVNVPYHGRVRVAHTLQELKEHLSDKNGLVIAQTLGEEPARQEVAAYASNEKVLTVKRAEKQCIYCAVRMAHCVGALVVIG